MEYVAMDACSSRADASQGIESSVSQANRERSTSGVDAANQQLFDDGTVEDVRQYSGSATADGLLEMVGSNTADEGDMQRTDIIGHDDEEFEGL
jgi:hypothetical protein